MDYAESFFFWITRNRILNIFRADRRKLYKRAAEEARKNLQQSQTINYRGRKVGNGWGINR